MDRILIVDDDNESVDYMRKVLASDNTCVDIALNEAQAVDESNKEPDVVLLDLNLDTPMSGKSLLTKHVFKKSLVIILTGLSLSDDDRADLMEQGVFDVILKPFNTRILFEKVKRAILLKSATRCLKPSDTIVMSFKAAQADFNTAQSILAKLIGRSTP